MSFHRSRIGDLPRAIGEKLARRLAVFLGYDGTLTPIVDRRRDAVISPRMREVVIRLAEGCPGCVVSGRDRRMVRELMGVHDLVVAGSHGFDIWSAETGTVEHDAAGGFEDVLAGVTAELRDVLASIDGVVVESKRASVAAHYRLVAEPRRAEVERVVERLLAEHETELKVAPGEDGLRNPARARLG